MHLADVDAIFRKVCAVVDARIADHPHSVVEADIERAVRHRQIDLVLPIKRITPCDTFGHTHHAIGRSRSGIRPCLGHFPHTPLCAGVLIDEVFDQDQGLPVPGAVDVHDKPPPHRAECILKLANGDNVAVKVVLDLQNSVRQQRIIRVGFARTARQPHHSPALT